MSDPMPGWYPDPEEPSRQRFWDGSQWTEARAYPVAAAPDGTPIAADTGAAEGSKSVSGTTIAVIVGLAIVLAFALWFFLLRGGSSSEPPVPAPTAPTAAPTADPTKQPTEPPVTPTVVPTAPVTPTAVPSP